MTGSPISVIYCSWSLFKKEEWGCIKDVFELEQKPGYKLGRLFNLEFRTVPTTEPLLCDLEKMVSFKVEVRLSLGPGPLHRGARRIGPGRV